VAVGQIGKRKYCQKRVVEYHAFKCTRALVCQKANPPSARILYNAMIKTGILNPAINHLLSRVRHTNTLVIADRGFPFWPMIETVDIALVDDVPTVLAVLRAIRPNFQIGKAWMAREFLKNNPENTRASFRDALSGIDLAHEPHVTFKKRVPDAIGLIRTGDTTQYANIILESA
jgi:D-ribose pyranase